MNLNFTLIIQIISFAIFLGLLTKFFYRPLMNYLEDRSAQIKKMVEETEGNRNIVNEEIKKVQEELKKTKEQVIKMKKSASHEADKHRRAALEQAKKEAAELLDRAKSEIKKELADAKEKLKVEVASLSIDVAMKILDREVKEKDHKKLISEAIEELGNAG